MAIVATVKQRVEEARERWPLLDHLVRTFEHYGNVNGSALAAAVTYFAFLSFFPIVALAFAVIGFISGAYPDAERDLVTAIDGVLPGIIGNGKNELSLDAIRGSAPGILSVGLLVALYSGLGWLSGMRTALIAIFEEPEKEQPSFLLGKARDILALLTLGTVLLLSVAVSGVATKLAVPILELLGLGEGVEPVVWVLGLALGLAASTVLFFAFFRVLAAPNVPTRALWSGALLGALAFEALKQLSTFLLAGTKEQPAAQAFGIALILVVWMNYFSRVVVLAAAWAHTSPAAREQREREAWREDDVEGPQIDLRQAVEHSPVLAARTPSTGRAGPFAAGAATMLALVAVTRRSK
ncbi:YihY/virulence factor BrkB family protein [Nocardioides sediminis]|uniref:YihY/virulence factor BrkB family protein n=1 Tax=Nocardioides sediminis TaxID=433648 RepID=UPI000D2FE787|nr:YhjD/YihY/BrkB family envelope integrity protein [Nocardioides sediminis]